jgi:1,4-alpha-glucan branching enzyme
MISLADTVWSWNDQSWTTREERWPRGLPLSIYEVHPDSWMRVPEENHRPLTGGEIAPKLADYVRWMDFTHVAILSAGARPFQNQTRELMCLIEYLHQRDVGVILHSQAAGEFPGEMFERYHADGCIRDDVIAMAGSPPFELQADRGWSRDVLHYFGQDPLYRKYHHDRLTARAPRAFPENFLLPLSHDEVTVGKGSLLAKMPGDAWRKFAGLRLLFAFMYAQPGKKLLFMGGEFGQWREWNPEVSLDWHLVREGNYHWALQRWVAELNHRYRREPALHQMEANPEGFEWADFSSPELSTLSWLRRSARGDEVILAVFNFTPVPRHNYRLGVPGGGFWKELLNSDAREYGGSGQGNLGGVEAAPFGWQSKSHSITVTLPPLGAVLFKRES